MKKKEFVLILHNLRSIYNVGAIFRTSDAAGVPLIYLTGYTPGPINRFGEKRKDFLKTSLGAKVAWKREKNIFNLLKRLKKLNYQIIALEQSKKSIDYKKIKAKNKFALIVGNEKKGLSSKILSHCDIVGEIKMLGQKESLNVSVALGIALFRILNI